MRRQRRPRRSASRPWKTASLRRSRSTSTTPTTPPGSSPTRPAGPPWNRSGDDLAAQLASTPAAIIPGGGNTWTASFFHPATGDQTRVADLTIPEGVVKVFAGARPLDGAAAAQGGYGGYGASGTADWFDQIAARGQAFAVWGGSLTFDPDQDWYFGYRPRRRPGPTRSISIPSPVTNSATCSGWARPRRSSGWSSEACSPGGTRRRCSVPAPPVTGRRAPLADGRHVRRAAGIAAGCADATASGTDCPRSTWPPWRTSAGRSRRPRRSAPPPTSRPDRRCPSSLRPVRPLGRSRRPVPRPVRRSRCRGLSDETLALGGLSGGTVQLFDAAVADGPRPATRSSRSPGSPAWSGPRPRT